MCFNKISSSYGSGVYNYIGYLLLVQFSKYLESFSMIGSGIRYIYDINSLAQFLLRHRIDYVDTSSYMYFLLDSAITSVSFGLPQLDYCIGPTHEKREGYIKGQEASRRLYAQERIKARLHKPCCFDSVLADVITFQRCFYNCKVKVQCLAA